MENQDKYEKLYHELIQQQQEIHCQNQKHIKNGIKYIIFIPLVFLALAFFSENGKVIFLTLWIVSMFLLSAYLIYIEYLDFQIQERIAKISENELSEAQSLIGGRLDEFEENVLDILKEWEESLPPRKKIEDILKMRHSTTEKNKKRRSSHEKYMENYTK